MANTEKMLSYYFPSIYESNFKNILSKFYKTKRVKFTSAMEKLQEFEIMYEDKIITE